MRKVFFSFEYEHDVWRSMVVRNSWVLQGREAAEFVDKAEFEKIKGRGDAAVKSWINNQLRGTSVTVVLVGKYTCSSQWVQYEIGQSIHIGHGLLGIDISKIRDIPKRNTTSCCGWNSKDYSFYSWSEDNRRNNMGKWIEQAAKDAGHLRKNGLRSISIADAVRIGQGILTGEQ